MITKKQENIKTILEDIVYKFKSSSSIRYKIFTGIIVIGFAFFLSSNMLFNKNSSYISTELKQVMAYENLSVSLEDREYNPTNGFIQFNVRIENKSTGRNLVPVFELRSKDDPTVLIPLEFHKVTDEEYIINTTYNKKWSYLSLSVNFYEDNNKNEVAVGPFKFYSNRDDTPENEMLVQRSMTEHYIQIIDKDIEEINEKIIQTEQAIEKNGKAIEIIKENNIKLDGEKKYQIEEEKLNTESQIATNESNIMSLEQKNAELNKQIKSLQEKISKLEIKKSDYIVGGITEGEETN